MFEKIRLAYELLSSVELCETQTDMSNVILLLKTQNIIYRRFPEAVADQKYPGYEHLINVLNVPNTEDSLAHIRMDTVTKELLMAGTILIYHTCSVSPLNVKQFVKADGIRKLYEIVSFAISAYLVPYSDCQEICGDILIYAMKVRVVNIVQLM